MIALYILLAVIAVIVLLLAICLVRTVTVKPTSAVSAQIPKADENRSMDYGKSLSKLVQIETISSRFDESRDKFYRFHEALEEMFPLIHKHLEKHVFNGSLLFKWEGKSHKDPILLMSHHDVVEASGEWEHPPFSGEIANGAVWGRGTVDTKASLFCFLTAVEELLAQGFTPDCDIYLASSCTEEWSGEGAPLTVQYLKEQGVHLSMLIDEGGMIISEPIGGVKGTYAMVGVLEKGYGDLKFTAKSAGGHASAPVKNTPLPRLGAFMQDVEKHNPFRAEFHDSVREMFARFAPNMVFGMKFVFRNLWLFGPLLKKLMPVISPAGAAMLQTTIAFTTAKGSNGLNVLPQEAYVTGNLRFIPHQGTDESIEIIRQVAKKHQIETQVIYKDYPCPVVDHKGRPFQLVEETIHKIYPGIGVCPYTMTGGTDAKYYSDICENAIRFAPLYITNQQYGSIHGINENINCDALPLGVDFYKEIIQNTHKARS